MHEERKNGGNGGAESGDPQFTTPGAGEQLDETTAAAGEPIPGPMEGQGGERREAEKPAEPRPRRKSAARRKGGAKKAAGKKKAGGGRAARGKPGAKRKGKARGAAKGAARPRARGGAKAKRGKGRRAAKRR